MHAAINFTLGLIFSPLQVFFIIISIIKFKELQVFISSKNTQTVSFILLFFSNKFFSFRNSIISLSSIPAWIFNICIVTSFKLAIILIKEVFPHPVSPIIITGILVLSLKDIKINLIKLSAVKTYDSTIFSKVFNIFSYLPSPIFFGDELSLSSIGFNKFKTFLTSTK